MSKKKSDAAGIAPDEPYEALKILPDVAGIPNVDRP